MPQLGLQLERIALARALDLEGQQASPILAHIGAEGKEVAVGLAGEGLTQRAVGLGAPVAEGSCLTVALGLPYEAAMLLREAP